MKVPCLGWVSVWLPEDLGLAGLLMGKQGIICTFRSVPNRSVIVTSDSFSPRIFHLTQHISESPHGHHSWQCCSFKTKPCPWSPALLLRSLTLRARWHIGADSYPFFPPNSLLKYLCDCRRMVCGRDGFCNSSMHNLFSRPVGFNGVIHGSGGCMSGPLGCKISGA